MDKISVVVPTLQKNIKVLNKLLELLARDKAVSEIIVINNAQTEIVLEDSIKDSNKLRIYNQKENLYVNPSWNLGISLCKNDKFFITNDDILYCENFCTKVLETGILDKEDTGLVGLGVRDMHYYDVETEDIDIPDSSEMLHLSEKRNYMYLGDWGSGFFGKKDNYYSIPDGIKVIYGDNYLLYKNLKNDKINYEILGSKYNHIHSLSSSSNEAGRTVAEDCSNYKQYIEEPQCAIF